MLIIINIGKNLHWQQRVGHSYTSFSWLAHSFSHDANLGGFRSLYETHCIFINILCQISLEMYARMEVSPS